MNVIYKENGKTSESKYIRNDISEPIQGLAKGINVYFIDEVLIENTDPERYDLAFTDELIDKPNPIYKHLFTCKRTWYLKEKSQNEVIQKLNTEFGNYMDTNYFPQTRIKHQIELLNSKTNADKKNKITALQEWLLVCNNERQKREDAYLKDGIFPDFYNYQVKPLNT